MDAATTVFLVRHASHDRVANTLCGRMPGVSLGEHGLAQAQALAEHLAPEGITALYSSPLERARETAAPIAERLGILMQVSSDFTEIDVGDWTGSHFDTLAQDPRWQQWNTARATARAPNGESMAAVQDRTIAALTQMQRAHAGERVAVVSHCDVIKAALAAHLGMSLNDYMRFEIEPASVSTLALWPEGDAVRGKILSLNHTAAARAA